MIHRWMERWFDTLLFLMLMIGMLFGFVYYWKGEFQIRCAEVIMQDFLAKASVNGKITVEMLEILTGNLSHVSPDYKVCIEGIKYITKPVYAQIPTEYLSRYFAERNQKKDTIFQEYHLNVSEENPEKLIMQEETNAILLSEEKAQCLPLPEDNTVWTINAVRPTQEVYEKEPLITLCRITSDQGSYYAEAEPLCADQSGIVYLNLQLGMETYQVPVNVLCYPRILTCKFGHEVVNTESVLKKYCQTGEVTCLYCETLPSRISCSSPIIYKKNGTGLERNDVELCVEYMDGHSETIFINSPECQTSYDKDFCGIQQVEIRYRGESALLTVISENEKCAQCGNSCNDRYYTDYLRFPYCISCLGKQEIFTCNYFIEEHHISQEELMQELEQKQGIFFLAGDYIVLRLMEQDKIISLMQRETRRDGE